MNLSAIAGRFGRLTTVDPASDKSDFFRLPGFMRDGIVISQPLSKQLPLKEANKIADCNLIVLGQRYGAANAY